MLSIKRPPVLAATLLLVLLAMLPLPHAVRDALAVLALCAAAATALDPRSALVLLVAYLPFRVLVEAMTPAPITFLPDAVVLALVLRVVIAHRDQILPLDLIEVAAIAFAAWGMLASVHAHAHLGAAVLEARDLLLFVLLYAAVRRLRQSRDGLDDDWWARIVPYALAAVALVGIQGILQTFVLGHAFLLPAKLVRTQALVTGVNAGRPYGWVDNPNVFGELSFLALVMAYDYFRGRQFRPRWLFGLVGALFAAMVVLSFSRSTYIVVLVAAVIFALAVGPRERSAIAVAVVAMAVAVALIPGARTRAAFGTAPAASVHVHHPGLHRHHHKTRPARPPTRRTRACTSYVCQSSRAGRLHNLKVALHLIRTHPLGTGLGTFGSAGALAFHVRLKGVPKNFYADNEYTVVLVETGLLGALLFALLGAATFWEILRARPRNARNAQGLRMLLVLFLGMAILGATSNAWEQLVLSLYPWLSLAAFLPPVLERHGPLFGRAAARPAEQT